MKKAYYTAGGKLCECKKFLVKNLTTGTNGFNPRHWDSTPKPWTVLAKPGLLECLLMAFIQ